MAGTRIRIAVDDASIRAALKGLVAKVADLRPAMEEIGSSLTTSTSLRFERQQDPQGRPWKPLAKSTLRRKKDGAALILHESGRLKQSVTHRATTTEVEIGTNLVYAAAHQLGAAIERHAYAAQVRLRKVKGEGGRTLWRFASRRHRKVEVRRAVIGDHVIKLPARPFLGVSAGDQQAVLVILKRHLAAGGGIE